MWSQYWVMLPGFRLTKAAHYCYAIPALNGDPSRCRACRLNYVKVALYC